jgi:hypothetical protein
MAAPPQMAVGLFFEGRAHRERLDHDPLGLKRIMILSPCLSMIFGQTLRVCPEGKPVPTFPDHALTLKVDLWHSRAPARDGDTRIV